MAKNGNSSSVSVGRLVLVVMIAGAGMMVYAPWSECELQAEQSCYAQQVEVANFSAPLSPIPPRYLFFWETPPDRVAPFNPNSLLEMTAKRALSSEEYSRRQQTDSHWGWRINRPRLLRQFAGLAITGLIGWLLIATRRQQG